ncbi:conserved hypothetical protein [Bradyrhizobium sp. ORS 278]|uniref:DUF72 domain-containing protein n=1 Tax=Bradyrhizobium sp. (strain ORS 278) TaxID=114615 RepID=UPI0001508659|nr:DUF72 domain-containing protein [Bradyrhizobium sp. ORS 278]CAL77226.1 conserved hypothetical protein [Bradyrhizobium sp. ORS 278]
MARVVVGTSGWHYDSWRGAFFPPGLLVKHQLRYYASQFETTELNGVFYRTPSEAAVRSWRDQTGRDFVFAWKASKFITHWKRLSERSVNSLELMEGRLKLLGDKAGPVLFQLPPQFEANQDRLASFLPLLPKHRRYSFEFRHPSWYTPATIRLLRHANVALCLSDHHDAPAPWQRTADFVYVRSHGPDGRYRDNYPAATMKAWATRISAWSARGVDVFVYFDNDQKSAAPADALQLRAMLDAVRRRSRPSSRRGAAEQRPELPVV